ncbi:MAG: hypothetical protein H6817_12055 [Phycisphaerales bacterium]|nr:hypothetical protein [Phycisphaerales bacterium]
MTLTVLLDGCDVAEVAATFPAALSGHVLAYDLPACFALQDRSIEFTTPWDDVSPEDLAAAQRFDDEVQAFWRVHARIPLRGMDLLGMARHRHIACLTRMVWAAFTIRRAIERFAPTEIVCFDDHTGHGLEQPPGMGAMPLLQPIVRGMAENMGIPVRLLPRARTTFTDRAAHASRDQGERVDLTTRLDGRPFVLFAGSGNDLLRQLPLIRTICRQTDLAVVQLYRAAGDDALHQLRDAGHHVYHESQVTNPSRDCKGAEEEVAAKSRNARAEFDNASVRATGCARTIFANPHIMHHWDFLFGDYARRMAAHVATWQEYFDKHRPELIVANYPTPLLEVGAQRDIPSLVLSHGIMSCGDARWYSSLPEVTLGAPSPAARNRLVRIGIPEKRIAITGDPGMDATLQTTNACARARDSIKKPRILLITSAIAAPAHQGDLPAINWAGALRTFDELNDLARRQPHWQFTIKPHPRYDQVDLYERLQADLPEAQRWHIANEENLVELVASADAVVVVNNRSSAIVEASLLSRPVFLLCGDMPGIDLAAWGLEHWPRLDTVAGLEQELTSAFAHPEYLADRAAQSQRAAEVFLGENPKVSDERCLTTIQQLIGNATLVPSA